MRKVEERLDGSCKSPNENVTKQRLKGLLAVRALFRHRIARSSKPTAHLTTGMLTLKEHLGDLIARDSVFSAH